MRTICKVEHIIFLIWCYFCGMKVKTSSIQESQFRFFQNLSMENRSKRATDYISLCMKLESFSIQVLHSCEVLFFGVLITEKNTENILSNVSD